MNQNSIKAIKPLGFPWQTQDPFIFCAYHEDNYPAGNEKLGPNASLAGRSIGQDFQGKDGWSMYHGTTVPGFPSHPHCGFETVTIVERGLVDHADSLGAAGRFGNGDVQWMTAGKGVQHSEMFPLLKQNEQNPFLLFQIWLNLPRASKKANPYFSMFWHEDIPVVILEDENGRKTTVKVVAGEFNNYIPPVPPPDSWASQVENELAIFLIKLEPGATWTLPVASSGVNRSLYYFKGEKVTIDGNDIQSQKIIETNVTIPSVMINGEQESHFLMLQGKPIKEPVVQYGPFVTNSNAEIQEVIRQYQETEFGGWPWPKHDQVHDAAKGRFAIYADGHLEEKS